MQTVLSLDVSDVFSQVDGGFEVSAGNLHSSEVSFSVYHIKVYTISICLITGNVNFSDLVRMTSVRLPTEKTLIFPLEFLGEKL